jgi:hypothetical protein
VMVGWLKPRKDDRETIDAEKKRVKFELA